MTPSKTDSPYRTLADVRAKNAENGYNFFDRSTMKHWGSRIESTLIQGRFIITSEKEFALDGREPARFYSVRYVNDDSTITTVSALMRRKDAARELIRKLKGASRKLTIKSKSLKTEHEITARQVQHIQDRGMREAGIITLLQPTDSSNIVAAYAANGNRFLVAVDDAGVLSICG